MATSIGIGLGLSFQRRRRGVVPFTGLLDEVPGAVAAYSVRRLSGSYSGSALRVRRDNDDAEQDIGFDSNGDLDVTALEAFVGAGNDGFVVTWYDQSGEGNDALQSVASSQKRIVENGNVVTAANSLPALSAIGDGKRFLRVDFADGITSAATYAGVVTPNSVDRVLIFDNGSSNNAAFFGEANTDGNFVLSRGTPVQIVPAKPTLFKFVNLLDTDNSYIRINGVQHYASTSIGANEIIGITISNLRGDISAGPYNDNILQQELIMYPRELSGDEIDKIEQSQSDKYSTS